MVGTLGVKTLDSEDAAFSGTYRIDDRNCKDTAGGFNYHQGPEWVWLYGCYLQCLIIANPEAGDQKTALRAKIYRLLNPHFKMLEESEYGGLVELTDAGGGICPHSCQTQAWSMATILDALLEIDSSL